MDDLRNDSSNTTVATTGRLQIEHSLMLWTICAFGVIALAEHSTILLITFLNKTLRQKPYIVAILLLSTSDIITSLALFLVSLTNLVPLKQTWVCGLAFCFMQVGFVTSLVHTLIICTERYLCMRPIPVEMLSLRKRQALTIINICLCALILGIPFLFSSKETTMEKCYLPTLYGDNLAYVQVPVRSLTLLIWLSTIIVYVITVKNFRDLVRRTCHLNAKHYTVSTASPLPEADVKSTENSQSEVGMTSSLSCTTLGLNNSGEGSGLLLEMNTQQLLSKSKITIIGDEIEMVGTYTLDAEPLEYESKVMKDEKDVNLATSEFDLDTISSLTATTLALNRPGEGMGLNMEISRQTEHTEAEVTIIGIDAGKANNTVGTCARTPDKAASDSTRRIFQDAKDFYWQVDVHQGVKTENVTGTSNRSKNCIESEETGNFQSNYVKQVDNERHLSQGTRNTHLNLPQRHDKLRRIAQIKDGHMMRAFKIVTVVFVVFFITMTPQCFTGLAMIFYPISENVQFLCAVLATSSLILNPIIYVLLLKEFREVVLICK